MNYAVPWRPNHVQVIGAAGVHASHGLQVEGEGAPRASPIAVNLMGGASGAQELVLAYHCQLEPVHGVSQEQYALVGVLRADGLLWGRQDLGDIVPQLTTRIQALVRRVFPYVFP